MQSSTPTSLSALGLQLQCEAPVTYLQSGAPKCGRAAHGPRGRDLVWCCFGPAAVFISRGYGVCFAMPVRGWTESPLCCTPRTLQALLALGAPLLMHLAATAFCHGVLSPGCVIMLSLRLHCVDYVAQNTDPTLEPGRRVWSSLYDARSAPAKNVQCLDMFAGARSVSNAFRPTLNRLSASLS